jgi:hypothetical protein
VLSKESAHDWVALMRAEYLEMPGLALSKPQARRLWGLDVETCELLLEEMVNSRFLRKTPHDRYVRADIDQ